MMVDLFGLSGMVVMIATNRKGWVEKLVEAVLDAGANLVILVQKKEGQKYIINERVIEVKLDLSYPNHMFEVLRQKIGDVKRIDALINAFNLPFSKFFLETSEDDWNAVMDTNLKTLYLLSRTVGKFMFEQGFGSIVNIISIAGLGGLKNASAYTVAAGGVIQLTKSLALEWASRNVRVNTVAIGLEEKDVREESKGMLKKYIPISRFVTACDVIPFVIFLISSSASYMSGHIYHVDGGLVARG